MPITKGARKAQEASLRKRVFNTRVRSSMKGVVKEVRGLVAQGEGKKAGERMSAVYKAIDKAVKRGVIKKNTASRKKSRLSILIKKTLSK